MSIFRGMISVCLVWKLWTLLDLYADARWAKTNWSMWLRSQNVAAPDNKSLGCCYHNSLPPVINPLNTAQPFHSRDRGIGVAFGGTIRALLHRALFCCSAALHCLAAPLIGYSWFQQASLHWRAAVRRRAANWIHEPIYGAAARVLELIRQLSGETVPSVKAPFRPLAHKQRPV